MISILTVTYNRAAWWPWLFYQVDKQTSLDWEHIVVDGGRDERLFELCSKRRNTSYVPSVASIPHQRNLALRAAQGSKVVWFDDDDWQAPNRLDASSWGVVIANRWGQVVDAWKPERADKQGYEPLIFNSAAISTALCQHVSFNEKLSTDEDIDWLRRLELEEYVILRQPLFAWMSHGSNITNSIQGRLFEDATTVPIDSSERAMLKETRRSK